MQEKEISVLIKYDFNNSSATPVLASDDKELLKEKASELMMEKDLFFYFIKDCKYVVSSS